MIGHKRKYLGRGMRRAKSALVKRGHMLTSLRCEQLEARLCLSSGTFGPPAIVSAQDEARGNMIVFPADLDGDGDIDILVGSSQDDTVAWYENADGLGQFERRQVISTDASGVRSIHAADLDGDGDQDAIAAYLHSKIVWYENMDGEGLFGVGNVISASFGDPAYLRRPVSLHAADVDGDDDQDILAAFEGSDSIAWLENTDGLGTFSDQMVISNETGAPQSVYAADIDGDGDLDALSASPSGVGVHQPPDPKIAWYENLDGEGNFGPQRIISRSLDVPLSVRAADLDGDGDTDVLSASSRDDMIAWYENTDGQGNFGPQNVITLDANDARSVVAADLDSDGDLDVLSGSWREPQVAWYENTDGRGSFGEQRPIVTSIRGTTSVGVADLDGDGDLDVISGSTTGRTIAWYEQLPPEYEPGDANRDYRFDQMDIVQILQRGKYLTDSPATWEEGDWSGDGLFGQYDIVLALRSGNYLQGPYAARAVDAVFEDAVGEAALSGLQAIEKSQQIL